MLDATITISKEELSAETLEYITDQNIFMYPLKLIFTSNVNFEDEANSDTNGKTIYPANVCVLQLSGTGFDPDQGDTFTKIASVTDMYDLPTADNISSMNDRSSTLQTPYYRVNEIELYCDTIEHLNSLYEKIKVEIKLFLDNYNLRNKLTTTENITIA